MILIAFHTMFSQKPFEVTLLYIVVFSPHFLLFNTTVLFVYILSETMDILYIRYNTGSL